MYTQTHVCLDAMNTSTCSAQHLPGFLHFRRPKKCQCQCQHPLVQRNIYQGSHRLWETKEVSMPVSTPTCSVQHLPQFPQTLEDKTQDFPQTFSQTSWKNVHIKIKAALGVKQLPKTLTGKRLNACAMEISLLTQFENIIFSLLMETQ